MPHDVPGSRFSLSLWRGTRVAYGGGEGWADGKFRAEVREPARDNRSAQLDQEAACSNIITATSVRYLVIEFVPTKFTVHSR